MDQGIICEVCVRVEVRSELTWVGIPDGFLFREFMRFLRCVLLADLT